MQKKEHLLAFVHVEKAAGSSLTNLLRYNFPLTHCEVKPLSKDGSRIFSACDMEKVVKINPWVKSISGHSITPVSDLRDAYPDIRYITILRDPIERFISAYLYFVDKREYEGAFQEFMEFENQWNFQVRKIAGVEDIEIAKEIIDREFLLIGIVDEYAGFLLLLNKRICDKGFKLFNAHLNKGRKPHKKETITRNLNQFLPELKNKLQLDIELFNYVKAKWRQEIRNYGPSYMDDLQRLRIQSLKRNSARMYLNFLYRNLYYKQVLAIVRIANNRKVRGSY